MTLSDITKIIYQSIELSVYSFKYLFILLSILLLHVSISVPIALRLQAEVPVSPARCMTEKVTSGERDALICPRLSEASGREGREVRQGKEGKERVRMGEEKRIGKTRGAGGGVGVKKDWERQIRE